MANKAKGQMCPCLHILLPFPLSGAIHLHFHSSGNHYVWRKVTSTVHNIIVGKLWIDQVCISPRRSHSL